MTYGLGVDLGTTWTAAAVRRGDAVEVLRLGGRRPEIPSLIFLPESGPVLVGEPAARRGEEQPGRLAREFKRRVGDPVPLLIGGSPYPAHALLARQLEHVLTVATAAEQGPPGSVVLACPANWGPYKRDLLEQAARLADAPPVALHSEPEAAAISYAAGEHMADGDVVAVYDLGGGTFDAAVLRRTATGFELLGTPEGIEQLGGADFDEAVFDHVTRILPADRLTGDDPELLTALTRLRRDCVDAKEALSFDTEVMIPVALPGLHTRVRLTRREFETMIAPALQETVRALGRALRSAQVGPDQLKVVLLAGGSSRIPLAGALVGEAFERPVVVDPNPEHSIALGAARLTGSIPAPAPARPATASARPSTLATPPPAPPSPPPTTPPRAKPRVAPPQPAAPQAATPPLAARQAPPPQAAGQQPAPPKSAPPQAAGSQPAAPQAAPPQAAPPKSVPPQAATPKSVPPQAATPKSVPARSGPPQSAAPPPVKPPTAPGSPMPSSPGPTPTQPFAVGRATPAGATEPLPAAAGTPAGSRRRRLRILVAAAAVLVIAVSVPITVRLLRGNDRPAAQSPPSSAGASASAPACGFTDDFTGTAVDPAWQRSRADTKVTVSGGAVDLDAPNGADIYGDILTAPMLLRPITGDFVLETAMEVSPTVFYQGAGLLLWNGPVSYVRMERAFGKTGTIGFEYNDGGTHLRAHGPLPSQHPITTNATRLVLRMVRSGGTITGSWRPADKPEFAQLASVRMTLPQTVKVGVAALNRAQFGAKPTPFHARFDQITVTC
ncbi:Hsp70 family protein [Paractinoplanes globisporus]|uniref:Hsp70 family protein n=1 Tax=Paractinoplanes globisporus TaxID=113565 RepID=A0ABW6W7A5_9ACTN|nr:Hsp70 family protein [Actinoplanes globisporus]